MRYYKPDRDIVREAISLCKKNAGPKYSENAVLRDSTEESVTIDGAILLISTVNRIRAKRWEKAESYDLKELVEFVCSKSPFESARKRAYVLVIMCFFLLMKDHVEQWNEERATPRRESQK
jgi:hypothetical protein